MFDTARLICFGARFAARYLPPTLSFRNYTLVFRWADVADVLARDGDFRIAPINAKRIEGVSGPFILGMDRSAGVVRAACRRLRRDERRGFHTDPADPRDRTQ